MVALIFYEVAIGLGGIFTSAFFLYLLSINPGWEWRVVAYKFTGALTLYSVMMFTQIISETWDPIRFAGYTLPSLQIIFEAIVFGFLVAGLWDIWIENRAVE